MNSSPCPSSMIVETRRAVVQHLDALMTELGTLSRTRDEGVLLSDEHRLISVIAASVTILRERIEHGTRRMLGESP